MAFGYASNALGTINPAAELTALAKAAGALVYIDAVQYAPHGPIDVQALGCDFLVCSAYKFFGPHVGILYGRYDLLEELHAYRVRPAPADPARQVRDRHQQLRGHRRHARRAGVLRMAGPDLWRRTPRALRRAIRGRRLIYKQAMSALRAYEHELSRALLEVIQELPGATIYGPTDLRNLDERVPTVSFTLQGRTPAEVATHLGQREHLRLERQLLRPGRHHPPGSGRPRRPDPRRRDPLQHPGRNRALRRRHARTVLSACLHRQKMRFNPNGGAPRSASVW